MQSIDNIRKIRNLLTGNYLSYNVQIKLNKEFFGTNYGGYYICPNDIKKGSIVYSFGVGEDISFDLAIIKKFGTNVFAFDPTPKSINWVKNQQLPKEFNFYPYGLASYDGKGKFLAPKNPKHVSYRMTDKAILNEKQYEYEVHKLNTILNMLKHTKIDILKIDIEGAEFAVIDDLITSKIDLPQLLVEFHHKFKDIGVSKTKKAIRSLNKNGFKIFSISPEQEVFSFIKI
jgi:FkbM family methyltransferase